ncbi:MAG: PAS domain S-box protein [Bacillota bacterium]
MIYKDLLEKKILLLGCSYANAEAIAEIQARLEKYGFSNLRVSLCSKATESNWTDASPEVVLFLVPEDEDCCNINNCRAVSIIEQIKNKSDALIVFLVKNFESGSVDSFRGVESDSQIAIKASEAEVKHSIYMAHRRKLEKNESRNYKERYDALFNNSLDCVIIFDFQGKVIDVNKAALQYLEYTKEELIKAPLYNILWQGEYNHIEKQINSLKFGGRQSSSKIFALRSKSGKKIFAETRYSVIKRNGVAYAIQAIAHDVTGKWDAEELKRALFENSVDPIIIIDLSDKVIAANNAVEQVFGYTVSELVNKHFPSEMRLDSTMFEKLRQVCITGEGISAYETKRRAKSGKIINVSIAISPIRDASGAITSIAFLYRDMTEFKLAEEKLSYQAMLLENVGDAIIASDENLNISAWNAAAEDIYQWRVEEVMGKGVRELVHSRLSDIKAYPAPKSSVYLNKYIPIEASYLRKDGVKITIEGNTIPLKDAEGRITGYVNVSRDITERKRTEEALKRSEERFRTIFESSPIGVAITVNLNIVQANKTFLKMFGYDEASEIIGQNGLNLVPQHEYGRLAKIAEKRKNGEQVQTSYETYGEKKDGTKFPLLVEVAFIDLPEGKASVAFVSDISEIKMREVQIRNSLMEKEILLKEVHHRVKNNLQIISSLLSLQSEYIKDEESLRLFNESRSRIKTMALLHEKLYQSRNFSQISFPEYVSELVYYLNRTYFVASRPVETSVDIENVYLPIDIAIPCGLIINELVSNSFKYAFSGSDDCILKVDFRNYDDGNSQLSVYDNGPGLPEDIDLVYSNTLGLQLVNSLVDQLNGKIELNTDNGTLFILKFRIQKD